MDTKKLRQKVLNLAIRGKLIPQDPNDEPASELVAKIRNEKERLIKEKKIKRDKNDSFLFRGDDKSYYENRGGVIRCIDSEIPFEIPESWAWVRLGSVLSKLTDGTHHSPINTTKGDFMYITAKNIKASGISLSGITFVSKNIHSEIYARCNPEKGDILYIKDGATTGIATINLLTEQFSMLSSVALLKPLKFIYNRFLLLFLQSSVCYNNTRNNMKGVGITRVTLTQMEQWLVPIAPKNEQKEIADKIDSILSIIESIENDKKSLGLFINQTKSKILNLALQGKLVPQDPNDEPASMLLKRIREERTSQLTSKKTTAKTAKNIPSTTDDNSHYEKMPFKIPDSWLWCRLSEVCSFERGLTFPSSAKQFAPFEKSIPCIRTTNVQDSLELNDMWHIPIDYINKDESKILRLGDIIMSTANSQELVGKTSYVHRVKINMTFGGFVTVIRPMGVDSKCLFYILRAYFNQGMFSTIATQTTNIANINMAALSNLAIPVPPLREQDRIVKKLILTFNMLDNIT